MAEHADPEEGEGQKAGSGSSSGSSAALTSAAAPEDDGSSSGRRAARRAGSRTKRKAQINDVVDDIINNSDAFGSQPRANMRDDNGVVKQVVKGLRSSHTFSRLRGQRELKKLQEENAADEAASVPSASASSSSSSSSSSKSSSSKDTTRRKRLAKSGSIENDVRSTLRKQKSTLTQREVRSFKSKAIEMEDDGPTDSGDHSFMSNPSAKSGGKSKPVDQAAGSRTSVRNIKWGGSD
jgi:hypothetical protein